MTESTPHLTIGKLASRVGLSTEASRHYEAFLATISGQPWHVEHQERSSKDLANGEGVLVEGLPITVNVETWLESNASGGANQ